MITIRIRDQGVAALLARARRVGANSEPILRAMGTTLKSITEGTFNSVGAAYRPSPWAPKRDGTPSILQKSTTLAKSFFLTVTSRSATVGNPMRYAAIHQFGGEIRPKNAAALRFQSGGRWWTVQKVTMPARPFFPITSGGEFTSAAVGLIVRAGERALARAIRGTP